MRNILFRGKREDNGEWVYGYLVKLPSAIQIGDYTHPWFIYLPPRDPDDNGGYYQVVPDTVGQYTGLTDKNGTKIFEGDILLFDFEDIGKQKAVVEWCQKYATFQMRPLDDFKYAEMPKGTIIGNIHDTPELLEAKE